MQHVADKRLSNRRHRIALDVFSPSLAWMVGQDLEALAPRAEWIKAMLYSTVSAPAGLPFELAGLLRWLGERGDREGSRFLANLFGYPVPSQALLGTEGLSSEAVRVEMMSLNRAAGERGVAGIEAMVLPGVVKMTKPLLLERLRIAASFRVPIALSWDLAHLPSDWLPEVQEALSAGSR